MCTDGFNVRQSRPFRCHGDARERPKSLTRSVEFRLRLVSVRPARKPAAEEKEEGGAQGGREKEDRTSRSTGRGLKSDAEKGEGDHRSLQEASCFGRHPHRKEGPEERW